MTLAPGMVVITERVDVTIGAATVPAFFNEGVGFMADQSLAVDSDAPTGAVYHVGIRQSAAGAFYGTTSVAATDVFIEGVRVSNIGQLVYEAAAPQTYVNGNPIRANGALAVI